MNKSSERINVTSFVLRFLEFLNNTGKCINDLMNEHDWDNNDDFSLDWMEANWKFLLENEFLSGNGFVTPYSILVDKKMLVKSSKPLYSVFAEWNEEVKDVKSCKIIDKQDRFRFLCFTNITDLNTPYKYAELYSDRTQKRFYVEIDKIVFIFEPFEINLMEII